MSLFGKLRAVFGNEDQWYCDGCNDNLNEQPGFRAGDSSWECDSCGFENDVSTDNLFESYEDYLEVKGIPNCPSCGSIVHGGAPDATYWFNCEGCNERFYLEGGELISPFASTRSSGGSVCAGCSSELYGDFTAPWEDGGNASGYVTCNSCGFRNDVEMG